MNNTNKCSTYYTENNMAEKIAVLLRRACLAFIEGSYTSSCSSRILQKLAKWQKFHTIKIQRSGENLFAKILLWATPKHGEHLISAKLILHTNCHNHMSSVRIITIWLYSIFRHHIIWWLYSIFQHHII